MEEEVKIRYEPFKELVIMQCTRFSTIEELARFTAIIAGGKPSGLYWAEGVAFLYFPLTATTDAAAKELIENRRVYWTFLSYAPMPTYKPQVEIKEKIIIPVINLSSNKFFKKVAQWLKEQIK
ncbi:MAG: hypothetical protein J7J44_08605 [Deltaproteobacteria bacterium]|nr:hypothetical protein [Deltaproteobacteria bacterium]